MPMQVEIAMQCREWCSYNGPGMLASLMKQGAIP